MDLQIKPCKKCGKIPGYWEGITKSGATYVLGCPDCQVNSISRKSKGAVIVVWNLFHGAKKVQ